MGQEIIAQVLDIERQAVQVHEEAERRAQRIVQKAREDAVQLRQQTLAEARQQADEIVAKGREEAQAQRERVISEAEQEAQQLESSAERNIDQAVSFVVREVAERR
jgi:ATP synthase H subunit